MDQAVALKVKAVEDAMSEVWAALDEGLLRWEGFKYDLETGCVECPPGTVMTALDYLLGRVRFVGLAVESSAFRSILAIAG